LLRQFDLSEVSADGPKAAKEEALKTVNWFIDCSDDDFTLDANIEFEQALRKRQIPHEFRIRNRGHIWEYWHLALYIALPFISDCFRDVN